MIVNCVRYKLLAREKTGEKEVQRGDGGGSEVYNLYTFFNYPPFLYGRDEQKKSHQDR